MVCIIFYNIGFYSKAADIIMRKLIFIPLIVLLSGCVNPGIETEYSKFPGPSLDIRKQYLDRSEMSIELDCYIRASQLPEHYCVAQVKAALSQRIT